MVRCFLCLLLIVIAVNARSQVIDSAPNGNKYYRTVTGGGHKVTIDAIISTDELIKRFEKPWQFVETGKMYWIGYTDDMYSIAARGNKAIPLLLKYIKSSKNEHGKYGAIYTLHLIGINCTVAGRFYEKFVNKEARKALLSLITDSDDGETVVELLGRDPWLSDVPYFMNALKNSNADSWYLSSGLERYIGDDWPFQQTVPVDIANIRVLFPFANMNNFEGPQGIEAQAKEMLRFIIGLDNSHVHIDKALLDANVWGSSRTSFINYANKDTTGITLGVFLNVITGADYSSAGTKALYYVEDEDLFICGPSIAKKRLISWWDAQSSQYKEGLKVDNAKPAGFGLIKMPNGRTVDPLIFKPGKHNAPAGFK